MVVGILWRAAVIDILKAYGIKKTLIFFLGMKKHFNFKCNEQQEWMETVCHGILSLLDLMIILFKSVSHC